MRDSSEPSSRCSHAAPARRPRGVQGRITSSLRPPAAGDSSMRARLLLAPLLFLLPALARAAERATIPITTSSPEARALYLEGRDLVERLKGTEAHLRTDKAVKLDPQFALALAAVGPDLGHRQGRSSPGWTRRWPTPATPARASSCSSAPPRPGPHARPAEQEQLLAELVKMYPSDPRVHAQLGIVALRPAGLRRRDPRALPGDRDRPEVHPPLQPAGLRLPRAGEERRGGEDLPEVRRAAPRRSRTRTTPTPSS